jgi:uncharacterized protein (DUF58 family)
VLAALAALLVPLVPGFIWALVAAVLLLTGAAAFEALLLRRISVVAERPTRQVLSLGVLERVTCTLRLNNRRTIDLLARQAWPSLIAERASSRRFRSRPGESARLEFNVRGVERGTAELPPLAVALSCWGLVERVLDAGAASEIAVFPDLRAVARINARLNNYALRGIGSRLSARLGKGREFDRLREYVRGDEYRDMAWKASARHGKLIVKEYRLDRSQDVLLCLDCGHRMAARVCGLSKLDHAVNGAVLLSYVCNRMEDRVGILSFTSAVTHGPHQGRGSAHLRRVSEFAATTRAGFVHSDYPALASALRRTLRHRALIVVFTALSELEHEPLLRAARAVSPPQLLLFMVLDDPDLGAAARLQPSNKAELCRTLVAQEFLTTRAATIRELRSLGALVVESTPTDVGLDAVNAYVDVKRRQLL